MAFDAWSLCRKAMEMNKERLSLIFFDILIDNNSTTKQISRNFPIILFFP
jgi:hypothetical protein